MTTRGKEKKFNGMFLLKAVYMIPLLLFGAWLVQLLYFPQSDGVRKNADAALTQEGGVFEDILVKKETVSRDHFHMVDEYVIRAEPRAPLCLTCHGTYPHAKEKKIRAILNFHTGFIACSVCHTKKEETDRDDIEFAWVDRNTGEVVQRITGGYGKYSAKIFPEVLAPDGTKRIFRPVSPEAANKYMELKDQYNADQISRAKIKLHEHISTTPVFCSECHKRDGYLDFSKLSFSKERIAHLNSTEIVGMIEKYKTFYLPSEIDFGMETSPK